MEKQKILTSKYAKLLHDGVKEGYLIENYKSQEFIYDRNQTLIYPNIIKPTGLLESLDIDNDLETAIEIFEAYKDLELIQASDDRLWVYLAHVDLYSYVVQRWPDIKNNNIHDIEKQKNYISNHWFVGSATQYNLLRHSISGLWWAVYLSSDYTRNDPYELTKILFRQLDFATRTLGVYELGRHKEAVIGILEFIKENESLFSSGFEQKTRYITKFINQIGGLKPIAYQSREFFTGALSSVSDEIKQL